MSDALSRRAWLRGGWLAGLRESVAPAPPRPHPTPTTTQRDEHAGTRRVARVVRANCLASASMFCGACVERCPLEGAMRLGGGRPIVNVAVCDGCGVCQAACPAPRNAIALVPGGPR